VGALGELAEDVVFLGGAVLGILITDPAAPPIRATDDVDLIADVSGHLGYSRLEAKLRERGFVNDPAEDAPICRYLVDGVTVDVMPTDPGILGFGNVWSRRAFATAEPHSLPDGSTVRVVTAPYFVATKLEAFAGRGDDDYLASHDIEDIISILDGRPGLVGEIRRSETELAEYVGNELERHGARLTGAIEAHLPADAASQARAERIRETIEALNAS